jgi:fructose-bisphosphate aldolase class II
MSRSATTDLLAAAAGRLGAVGAFNVIHLETAEAIVSGAELAGLPVILQVSQNAVRYHGALEPLARALVAIADGSIIPAAIHLDHAEDAELARLAVELGFDSVMLDASRLEYAKNVEATANFVEFAHAAGVSVEAELGEIGGKDGAHAPEARTGPDQAAAFVTATGVDCLAVAVGSSHAMTDRRATLDLDLIAVLADSVPVPLVLHGSSGVPDDQLVRAIRSGIRKVNVSTLLNSTFTNAVRNMLESQPTLVDSRTYFSAGRRAVATEVARLVSLFAGGTG